MKERTKAFLCKLMLVISWCALVALSTRQQTARLLIAVRFLSAGALILLLLPARYTVLEKKINWRQALVLLLVTFQLVIVFRARWLPSLHVYALASRLHLSSSVLVTAAALLGTAAAIPLELWLLQTARRFMDAAEASSRNGDGHVGRLSARWVRAALVFALLWTQLFALQFGVARFPQNLFFIKPLFFVLNLGILMCLYLLLLLAFRRRGTAALILSVLTSVWAIANHYVYRLHGGPLLLSELANARTALDVAAGYRVAFGDIPWAVLAFAMMSFSLWNTLRYVSPEKIFIRWKGLGCGLAVFAAEGVLALLLLTGPDSGRILGWSYSDTISNYGFGTCVMIDAKNILHPFRVPDGYSPDVLPDAVFEPAAPPAVAPDIILILNETFCDLDYYTPLRADTDYLAPFYSIDGAVYGHAVTPNIGGSTNNSEYELLTANSMHLINAPAPFNFIDFTEKKSNTVQYLKRLGYTAFAMHLQSATNYSRNTVYPAMGFDDTMLGREGNPPSGIYGSRIGLDANYYDALIGRYDSFSGEEPRFLYALTYQNHGGYNQNPAKLDTVHALTDFGDLDSDVDEFLTSMAMSAEAFRDLTAHFAAEERPIIICMVGDHAPSFIASLFTDKSWPQGSAQIAQRVVPYVMWSNYGADFSGCTEYASMFSLMPEVVRSAGLPLTPYYRCILDLKKAFPVLVSNGVYQSTDGTIGTYAPEDPACDPITEYYYLEYASLADASELREDLFLPAAG